MSNTPNPQTKPTWQKPTYLIGGAIIVMLLLLGIAAASGVFSGKQPTPVPTTAPLPTSEPGKPVKPDMTIQQPTSGAVLDITKSVTVKGEGQGLFEGNVVVQAVDANGAVLAETAATLQGKDVGAGGKGSWSADLNLQDVTPGTPGKIVTFSTDPKTGGSVAETDVDVTYGEESVSGPSTLEGPLWLLTLINGQKPLEDAPVTAQFEKGNLSGSAGCNTYKSGYQSDDKNLTIGAITATRQACAEPAGVMEQESSYLSLLSTAATYSTANGALTIFDASGAAILNYTPAVAGTLSYKERIALPDGAQVIVTLEDVSKADAPAEVIGQTIMAAPAGPPIPFAVTYSLKSIDSTHTYAVRAQIKDADGALLFTSTTSNPVITQGNPSSVTIDLSQP